LTLLISRTLAASGLGVYTATLAYYNLVVLVAEIGATNFLVQEIAKDRTKTSRYVVHLSIMAAAVGVIVAGVAAVLLPYLRLSPELATNVTLVLVAVVPGVLSLIQEGVFVAHQRVELQAYITLVSVLLNLTGSCYLLLQGYGVVALVAVFVAVKSLTVIGYCFFTHRYIAPLRWEFDWSFARSLGGEIKAFTASSFLAGFFVRPEIILLSALKGDAQTGFYSAALKLVDLWHLVPETYMTNVFPVLSRTYHLADRQSQVILDESVRYLLALSLPIAVGLTTAASAIIQLFYGEAFAPAVLVLQILAWNLPLYCLNSILWRVLVARGRQGANVGVQAITSCSRLFTGCVLVIEFGYLGAALSMVLNLLFHNRLLAHALKRDGVELHAVRLIWRFAAMASVMGVLIMTVGDQVRLWLLTPCAAAVYFGLLIVSKAVSPQELAVFRQVWRSRTSE
jgi:O-antigen/teichoic acid export membrane protein